MEPRRPRWTKNIANDCLHFGRLLCALSDYQVVLEQKRSLSTKEITEVIKQVYSNPPPKKRQLYLGNWVRQNIKFLLKVLPHYEIGPNIAECRHFETYEELGTYLGCIAEFTPRGTSPEVDDNVEENIRLRSQQENTAGDEEREEERVEEREVKREEESEEKRGVLAALPCTVRRGMLASCADCKPMHRDIHPTRLN